MDYSFHTENEKETVAEAITRLNEANPEDEIKWEHSCHQKKCGACAMVINGRPMLACDAVLGRVAHKGIIRVAPLGKFPIIADLMVDRSILYENLNTMKNWAEGEITLTEKNNDFVY